MDINNNISGSAASPSESVGMTMTTNQLADDAGVVTDLIQKTSEDTASTLSPSSSRSTSPGNNMRDCASSSEEFEKEAPEIEKSSVFTPSKTSMSPSQILATSEDASTSEKEVAPDVSRWNRFLTPRKVKQKQQLQSLFNNKPGMPSPPKVQGGVVDMSIDDVDTRMRTWLPCTSLLSPETYTKLAFAIGKGLDLVIIAEEGRWSAAATAMKLVDEKTEIGERFESVYRSDGDVTATSPPGEEGDACGFDSFIARHHPEFNKKNNAETYTVFKDQDHSNMQWFRREQTWGNCHWQGPILLHWYLQLWRDPKQDPGLVMMIHLSTYIRNTYNGKLFYEHVIKGEAADSFVNASKIIPGVHITVNEAEPFAQWAEWLKKHGPALAEINHVYEELHQGGRMKYSKIPCGDSNVGGHGLILVGVRSVQAGNDSESVYFLLQNYWKDKLLLEIRQDYFFACEGKIGFFNGKKIKPITDETYSEQTHKVRYAATTPSLEVPNRRKIKVVQHPRKK